MKIDLMFMKWKNRRLERVTGSEMLALEDGVFYGGTIFQADIELSEEQETELRYNLGIGYIPTFWATVRR